MANLAASAVTFNRSWTEGGTTGKELSCRQVTLVLTGQGDATDKILATVLSLTKIEQATLFVEDDNTVIYKAVPSFDGSMLLLGLVAADTPAAITGTIRGVVKGY